MLGYFSSKSHHAVCNANLCISNRKMRVFGVYECAWVTSDCRLFDQRRPQMSYGFKCDLQRKNLFLKVELCVFLHVCGCLKPTQAFHFRYGRSLLFSPVALLGKQLQACFRLWLWLFYFVFFVCFWVVRAKGLCLSNVYVYLHVYRCHFVSPCQWLNRKVGILPTGMKTVSVVDKA